MSEKRAPLRILSYLVPSLPVELFELFSDYLEDALKQETSLSIESRYNGPQSGRFDPFEANAADLAFISGSSYQELRSQKNPHWELLPVGAVYRHHIRGDNLGYFADLIIHRSSKERTKDFLDLRGSNWATNHKSSLSGHTVMLKLLKEKGENVSFFGSVLSTGSHAASIQHVAQKKADVSTVDSVALACALIRNPDLLTDLEIFDSIGPLPPHPIMVRASLPAEQKQSIVNALLKLHESSPWNEKFLPFTLTRFLKTSEDSYYTIHELQDQVSKLSASVRYY